MFIWILTSCTVLAVVQLLLLYICAGLVSAGNFSFLPFSLSAFKEVSSSIKDGKDRKSDLLTILRVNF